MAEYYLDPKEPKQPKLKPRKRKRRRHYRRTPWSYPLRPQIMAAIVAVVGVVLLDAHYELPPHAVTPAISGLTGIAGYLIGKDTKGDA